VWYNWKPLNILAGAENHSPSLPSLFPLLIQWDRCSSPLGVGVHVSVSRMCQPWEWSPFSSRMPVVEDPGWLRHPTSIFAMQLLKRF